MRLIKRWLLITCLLFLVFIGLFTSKHFYFIKKLLSLFSPKKLKAFYIFCTEEVIADKADTFLTSTIQLAKRTNLGHNERQDAWFNARDYYIELNKEIPSRKIRDLWLNRFLVSNLVSDNHAKVKASLCINYMLQKIQNRVHL